MVSRIARLAAVGLMSLLPTILSAEGVSMIEDFEGYPTGVGAWTGIASGVSVSLSLGLTNPIEGTRDLAQGLGLNALGGGYTVSNMSLNVPVSSLATKFRFKYRPLIGLNVNKTVQVSLRDQDNAVHVAPPLTLQLLQLGSVTDYAIELSSFTPSASGGVITSVTGVSLVFNSTVAVVAEEHIDSIRLAWDNSNVADWTIY